MLIGSLLIAVALNIFFKGTDLVPAGLFGLCTLYNYKVEMDIWLVLLLANIFFTILGILVLHRKKLDKAILPFLTIPALIYLTDGIARYIDLTGVDRLLTTIYGGVLVGLGYRFIYKEGFYVSGTDILSILEYVITGTRRNLINYAIDVVIIAISVCLFGIENSMYSLITIFTIETLSHRASLGTSDSKVFYIITKKEKDVREFILNELHYELTVFDVKGGFLKTKNTVLMSVIPTKDYYKLREGVKLIDPQAFISITDSYEVINHNRHLKLDKSPNKRLVKDGGKN